MSFTFSKAQYMDMDFSAYQRWDFPVDQPIEALRTDHRFVRELFERHFQAQDADEKKPWDGMYCCFWKCIRRSRSKSSIPACA